MKIVAVRRKFVLCDGCEENNASKKLVFNVLNDSVYMCDTCFEGLKKAVKEG